MTVADLLVHLEDMSRFLGAAGAKKVADDLDVVRDRLGVFQGYSLKAFGDFLVEAERFSREGPAPGRPARTPRTRSAGATQARLTDQQLKDRTVELYQKATDPAISREMIEETVAHLDRLPRADLDAIARQLLLTEVFRNKPSVIKAIGKAILDRKGSHERAQMS
jgi:hypothetical protein